MADKRDGKWIAHVRPEMPLSEAARHVLLARLQVVADYLPRALFEADRDPENVHQLRVGTRRAAAALRIFDDCLPGKARKRAGKRLRRLRQAAGVARDWDVFVQNVETLRAQRPAEEHAGLDFLIGYAYGQRTMAQVDLEKAGHKQGRDFEQFVVETIAAVAAPKKYGHTATLLDLAGPMLATLLHDFEQTLSGDLHEFSHLHQVRIAGKRLRYAMEVFVDCFEERLREVIYPLIEETQEILGGINDSYVGADRLAALAERLQAGPLVEWARIGPGVQQLTRWHEDHLPLEKQRFFAWVDRWREAGAAQLASKSK